MPALELWHLLVFRISLILISKLIPLLTCSIHCMQRRRQRRHTPRTQHISCKPNIPLKRHRQPPHTFLLGRNQLLCARLANQLLLRRRCASNLQQRHRIGLCDGGEPGVPPSHVTLPVWILGDVGGRDGDGIVVGVGVEGAWRWVAELRVHGDTGRSLGVERENAVDEAIEARRLDCVFLHWISVQASMVPLFGVGVKVKASGDVFVDRTEKTVLTPCLAAILNTKMLLRLVNWERSRWAGFVEMRD